MYKLSLRSFLRITSLFTLAVLGVMVSGNVTTLYAAVNGWNAGNIMSDGVLSNKSTMNAGDIQTFLNSKVPVCDTYGTKPSEYGGGTRAQYAASVGVSTPFVCLKDYNEGGRSSAQIIYNISQQYSINPQVLIVLLQKEQGLVTDEWPFPLQYKTATGYGCPDTAPCDQQYYGLTNQLTWSATMFRAILDSSPTWYTPYILGNNFIGYSPDSSCGGSQVTIANRATQALYNYTPYQPNQAALDAGWGTVPCGAYGNRNFYLYFTSWFGSTQTSQPYNWIKDSLLIASDPAYSQPYSQTDLISIEAGSTAYVKLRVLNIGYDTWTKSNTFLGTTTPLDRLSTFVDQSWTNPARIGMAEDSVTPGEYGTFSFSLRAPTLAQSYDECFNLVIEGVAWMQGPGICLNIDVVQRQNPNIANLMLTSGQELHIGEYLMSPATSTIALLQADGNFILYSNSAVKWASGTNSTTANNLIMQADGNLVLYDTMGHPLWASGTDGNPGSKLIVQSDGNAVIYSSAGTPLWATGTAINPGYDVSVLHQIQTGILYPEQSLQTASRQYRLIMQTDGNLVLYSGSKAVWASNTNGNPGAFAVMQSDGNLVVYTKPARPIWASNTSINTGTHLIMQDDGNLVLYSSKERPLWATATNGR